MTDVNQTPTIPPLILTLAHDYAQKGLTAISVLAMSHGAAAIVSVVGSVNHQTNQQVLDSAIQFGVGLTMFGVSCAWTYIAAKLRKSKMTELLNVK